MLRCGPVEYVPGEFYKRELPLLLAVINDVARRPSMLVIDGYVWLGAKSEAGLGAYLFKALCAATTIIGIAKAPYRDDTWSERVYRGESRRPLYVRAPREAATLVATMHGKNRIPTLLRKVDRLARAAAARGYM